MVCQCTGACKIHPYSCHKDTPTFSLPSEWKEFPDTAPKDRKIIIYGEWQATKEHPNQGDSPIYVMAHWSTIMSNGTGYNWYTAGFETLDNYPVVKWMYWTELPRYLGRIEGFEQQSQLERCCSLVSLPSTSLCS